MTIWGTNIPFSSTYLELIYSYICKYKYASTDLCLSPIFHYCLLYSHLLPQPRKYLIFLLGLDEVYSCTKGQPKAMYQWNSRTAFRLQPEWSFNGNQSLHLISAQINALAPVSKPPLLHYWLHTYPVNHDSRIWKEEKWISVLTWLSFL